MRHQVIAGLCFAIVIALFARANGYNVKYGGGSLSDAKAGTELKMYIDAYQVRFVKDDAQLAKIPPRLSLKSATARMSTGEAQP